MLNHFFNALLSPHLGVGGLKTQRIKKYINNKYDLLKFRNFGKKSLTELEEKLESLNLSFGMDVAKYKLDKE